MRSDTCEISATTSRADSAIKVADALLLQSLTVSAVPAGRSSGAHLPLRGTGIHAAAALAVTGPTVSRWTQPCARRFALYWSGSTRACPQPPRHRWTTPGPNWSLVKGRSRFPPIASKNCPRPRAGVAHHPAGRPGFIGICGVLRTTGSSAPRAVQVLAAALAAASLRDLRRRPGCLPHHRIRRRHRPVFRLTSGRPAANCNPADHRGCDPGRHRPGSSGQAWSGPVVNGPAGAVSVRAGNGIVTIPAQAISGIRPAAQCPWPIPQRRHIIATPSAGVHRVWVSPGTSTRPRRYTGHN